MYCTYVSGPLHDIDDALVRMRRLWSAAPRGVDMSSVLVVEACARAGGPATVGDVARVADVEHSTASRLVERAVRAGYVERAADGRRAALHLTADGRALRERAVAFRTAWLTEMVGDWPDEDVAAFARLLTRFAERIAEKGGPGALLPPDP
jgi:DNA-binding MarR family transcriptional regulator